jgi:hypothetical protein
VEAESIRKILVSTGNLNKVPAARSVITTDRATVAHILWATLHQKFDSPVTHHMLISSRNGSLRRKCTPHILHQDFWEILIASFIFTC